MKKQEKYWTYKAPPTPEIFDLPPGTFKGTEKDWNSLSPGMRREIYRSAIVKAERNPVKRHRVKSQLPKGKSRLTNRGTRSRKTKGSHIPSIPFVPFQRYGKWYYGGTSGLLKGPFDYGIHAQEAAIRESREREKNTHSKVTRAKRNPSKRKFTPTESRQLFDNMASRFSGHYIIGKEKNGTTWYWNGTSFSRIGGRFDAYKFNSHAKAYHEAKRILKYLPARINTLEIRK